jgi:hydroxymethylglutaryl-CoA lyase
MPAQNRVRITECPRDAMQGIEEFIPTSTKINYLNRLLKVGFDTLDFGSFVSPKAIPQLSDTKEVLESLNLTDTGTKLLAIVANLRGCREAASFAQIKYIGFPFSVSETFQQKNTNKSIDESFTLTKEIVEVCKEADKEPVIYLSMAFGNPYGDPWDADIVTTWASKIADLGITRIALADTVGIASSNNVFDVTSKVISELNDVIVGSHLHCRPDNWREKVDAAYSAGCRHFDTALRGYGGCPMAEDELVGNLATENLVQYLKENDVDLQINNKEFEKALISSTDVFH